MGGHQIEQSETSRMTDLVAPPKPLEVDLSEYKKLGECQKPSTNSAEKHLPACTFFDDHVRTAKQLDHKTAHDKATGHPVLNQMRDGVNGTKTTYTDGTVKLEKRDIHGPVSEIRFTDGVTIKTDFRGTDIYNAKATDASDKHKHYPNGFFNAKLVLPLAKQGY